MNDPYEEERQSRFVQPLDATIAILAQVQQTLATARDTRHPGEATDLYDDAMNTLFELLSMSQSLAFRRAANRRLAFIWAEKPSERAPDYRWVVCYPSGTCRQGTERSQRECENAVERLLSESV